MLEYADDGRPGRHTGTAHHVVVGCEAVDQPGATAYHFQVAHHGPVSFVSNVPRVERLD